MEKNIYKQWLHRSYIAIMLLLCAIPIVILFTRTGEGRRTYENRYTDISDEWSLTIDGEKIPCSEYGAKMDGSVGKIDLYYRLPERLTDTCIMYRSKDVYTKVYVEDELLYETAYFESPLYNRSPGNLWNTVKLNNDYAGKVLRLEVKMVYDTGSVCVDNIRMGEKMNIVIGFAMSKVLAICVSMAMIIIGLTLLVLNVYSLFDKNIPKTGNFSLAAFSIIIGMWCFIETNVLQCYMDDGRLLQLIDNMCMFIGLLPMVFYLDSFYNFLRYRWVRIIAWLDVLLLTFCFVVQVLDLSDFHHWIVFAWIFFGVFAVIMIVITVLELWKRFRARKLEIPHVMHVVGFALLLAAGIGPGFMYMDTDTTDRARLIRVGVFLFILCSAIGNQIQNYHIMNNVIKYDLVKNLAYQDGLTGLNNRTSYLEKMKEYEEKDIGKLGIVFLDINNLKKINDRYGHHQGDEYIMAAASVIKDSFGVYGNIYRIGGDEFCVFIEGIDIQSVYKAAKASFVELCKEKAEELDWDIEFEIAHGFEIYSSDCGLTLREVIKAADDKMYQDKSKMKTSR